MWNTNTPTSNGKYLVTTKTALIIDSRTGPASYAYETDVAEFVNNEWSMDGVIAWAELPCAYYPQGDRK